MSKPTIIIPSAKIVPEELQYLGAFPAVIYPINSKISFDYLYNNYRETAMSIKVVCYENADLVQNSLQSYRSNIVSIEVLPELKDLGYTVLEALNGVDTPVIINFADTIIMDSIDELLSFDSFFFAEDYISDKWTFYSINNGVIETISDKVRIDVGEKRRLFVGVFSIQNTGLFRDCLTSALRTQDKTTSSFYHALMDYSQFCPLKEIEAHSWFDIGHIDKYNDSLIEVKAREFNHISVDKERGILNKTSENKEKFIGEILWYLKLPAEIEYVRPRIFSYSTDYNAPYVSMEYYDYHTIHELFLYGNLSYIQWNDVFHRILFVLDDLHKYSLTGCDTIPSLKEMYLDKTLKRLEELKRDEIFLPFFEKTIVVNGERFFSLNKICKLLREIIPQMLYDVDTFHIIHGDMCFSNIMIDSKFSFIKLIDPRGKFGKYDIYGDIRYELAKLFHSIDGKYDYIIKDLFIVNYSLTNPSIEYEITHRQRSFDIYDLFLKVFHNEIADDLEKIQLIEALLFLSMLPLHSENIEHQMAMLATGLEILNRVISIKEGQTNV